MPANEQVQAFYDLAGRAAKTRASMRDAVQRGLTQQYHRALRETPEVALVDGLLAVRRQMSDLAKERKRVQAAGYMPEREQMEVEQIDQAMTQLAEGTSMWAAEWVSGNRS